MERGMGMHIIVCEDDSMYLKSIIEKIKNWSEISHHADAQILMFSSSEDLLEQWNQGIKADIMFLDIQFGSEMDGMELAKQIRETDSYVPIVFITNSEAYIREGYKVQALRYLSKPVSYNDLAPCLDIAYKQYTLSHNKFFICAEAGQRIAIRHAEIYYFEAQSPYSLIHRQDEKEATKLRYRFADVLSMLPRELFVPCHRSYIVNIIHIRGLKRTELLLSDGSVLPVSKPYVEVLSQAFDSYYQEGGVYRDVDGI